MRARSWFILAAALIGLGAIAAAVVAVPEVVRRVAIARVERITHRPVRIEHVELNLWSGRIGVRGFRVEDPASGGDLASFERLDARIGLASLLRGRLWIREATLEHPLVRVVRSVDGFNVSDLFQGEGAPAGPLDIAVDRFELRDGAVTLEDRALDEPRTWTSEQIHVRAENVSTRHADGTVEVTSVTAGAPAALHLERFRLSPIQLRAHATATGVDLSLARLYLPPDSAVVVTRGHATSDVTIDLDAASGILAEATGSIEDLAVVNRRSGETVALVPSMTMQLDGLSFRDDQLAIARLEVAGTASVLDPTSPGGPRLERTTVKAAIADVTWPITTPGQLDVRATMPGGGIAALTGALRPPPAASQLRLRLARLNLAPWARLAPVAAQITGTAESTLEIDEPLAASVPARVRGAIAVDNLAVRDGNREVAGARRMEASGLVVQWPARIAVKQLVVNAPQVTVDRDKAGDISLRRLLAAPGRPADTAPGETRPAATSPGVAVGEIAVRGGGVTWRDAAVTPPAALHLSRIDASVKGAAWPVAGPVELTAALEPPGGGQVEAAGRIDVQSLAADLRVSAKGADVSPYVSYLATSAHIAGRADLDLAIRIPPSRDEAVTARGTASLSRVDVRDDQRTVFRLDRATATGVEVAWPQRAAVERLSIERPWLLVERDERASFALRALLPGRPAGRGDDPADVTPGPGPVVDVHRLEIDRGGARVVDRSLSPPFAVDLSGIALGAEGLSTQPDNRRAQVSLKGQVGNTAILELAGTIGALRGPLHLDLRGTLARFWVPVTDSYLLRYVGWEARQGSLTTTVQVKIDRDVLDAKTDIRLSQLALVRASHDEAERRIGLPLGLIASLMKDSRGDIHVSLPVGGRLGDPRFDFREAIWSTVRNAAIKAITLPVSWIGRVRLTSDSRIDRIEIDPVSFEPGTASPSPEGHAQITRLVQFLSGTPDASVRLTPVVSPADLAALRQQTLEKQIEALARDAKVSADEASMRLFHQRFPTLPPPETPAAARETLAGAAPRSPDATGEIARARVETVRALVKKAGGDPARLPEGKPVEGADAAGSLVALDLATSDSTPGAPRSTPDLFRRPTPEPRPRRDDVSARADALPVVR